MSGNKQVAPFLKWVGGKRQLLPTILKHLPKDIHALEYVEPFVGGGALLFQLQPPSATINDANAELVNVYEVIQHRLEELLQDLRKHENQEDYFYRLRALDRSAAISRSLK